MIENLPVNGRNFIDFAVTTPGVSKDSRFGDISFAGLRGTLNSLVVDGADNNNTFFGQSLGRTGDRTAYQFSQVDAKTDEQSFFFKGFPSVWNFLVLYMMLLGLNP